MATPAPPRATSINDALEQVGVGRFQWRLLLINGLTWAADAMEVLIAGFVLPGVTAAFALQDARAAQTLFLSAGFAGMFLGALFWGTIADRYGRRRVFLLTVLLDALFGLASALAPAFGWLVLFRFLTGFAVGGTLPVDYSLLAEFVPTRARGKFLIYLESFWALGTIAVALLAWLAFSRFVPAEAWRWVLGLSAVPGLIGYWIRRSVPESPRYLVISGREAQARAVLEQIARENGRPLQIARLSVAHSEVSLPLAAIWRGALLRPTLLLSIAWFSLSLGYYGVFTWLPTWFRAQGLELGQVYRNTVILALAQVPGYLLAAYLVDRIGRRWTLALYLFGSAAASFLFMTARSSGAVLATSSLLSFALLGAWGALYVFTPELYSTDARTTGMGWASAMARLASIFAPSVGGALMGYSLAAALSVYAAFFVLGGVAALLITVETRNRPLSDVTAPPQQPGEQRTPRAAPGTH
ncbi:MFS transporter [Kallotenue papyrolyticum]|uniref:MFS transporter n=1 Tax=Kallotenue papyrolyticum TaxID=1325125 RepID=UPI000478570B|nr:MFS transporter [Kallotenue papyrolyticum]